MNQRTAVTAADLFVLIDREFRRRRPRKCTGCFLQLPYRVDVRDEAEANWEVVVPPDCGNGCNVIAEELVGEFQQLYNLKPSDATERS